MAKVKAKVTGAYVDGNAPGTTIELEEESAAYFESIGYVEREKQAEKPKPKASAKQKAESKPKGEAESEK